MVPSSQNRKKINRRKLAATKFEENISKVE